MGARRRFPRRLSSKYMITVITHAFCIVQGICMSTIRDLFSWTAALVIVNFTFIFYLLCLLFGFVVKKDTNQDQDQNGKKGKKI